MRGDASQSKERKKQIFDGWVLERLGVDGVLLVDLVHLTSCRRNADAPRKRKCRACREGGSEAEG